jgi:hypothetical protein
VSQLTASSPFIAASLAPRDVLRSTWALFQSSWPSGLPLALAGVAAAAVPGAEAVARGEPRGLTHDAQWWALCAASIALTLICYGALTLRQASIADRSPLPVFEALRRAAFRLPASASVAVLVILAIGGGLVLLVLPGLVVGVLLSQAWLVVLTENADPVAAIRRSIALVRGRLGALAAVYGTLLAAVLVFVMLAGIFVNVLMSVAGQAGPTSSIGQLLSRLCLGLVNALPVAYASAAQVVIQRTLRASPQA